MEAGFVRKDLKVAAFAEVFTAALMGGMLRRTSGLSKLKREGWLQQTVDLMARSVEV
jgi:hypothetical protein